MTITATHTAFANAMAGIAALAHDRRDRLITSWRYSLHEVDDHIAMIRQHRATIDQRDEMILPRVPRHSPAYVEHAERMLAYRLPRYLEDVRRVSECEIAMTAAGIEFERAIP